jgi:hypothetical protein
LNARGVLFKFTLRRNDAEKKGFLRRCAPAWEVLMKKIRCNAALQHEFFARKNIIFAAAFKKRRATCIHCF